MPLPPSVVSFSHALNMSVAHTKLSTDKALDLLIAACCDGALECYGHHEGKLPEPISTQQWMEFRYSIRAMPYAIENIEILSFGFFEWLLAGYGAPNVDASIDGQASSSKIKYDEIATVPIQTLPKSSGRTAVKKQRIMSEMRAMKPADLEAMKGKQMEDKFKAARTYCEGLRKQVMSESVTRPF